jgi:hypothetical protein
MRAMMSDAASRRLDLSFVTAQSTGCVIVTDLHFVILAGACGSHEPSIKEDGGVYQEVL